MLFMLHQLKIDIAVDEMHFLLKRNRICLTINHNIAKHLRKLQHTVGSLLIVNINQRINVIQGIEQKMRVNLRFQVAQLHFEALHLQLISKFLVFLLTSLKICDSRDSRHYHKHHYPDDIKDNNVSLFHRRSKARRQIFHKIQSLILDLQKKRGDKSDENDIQQIISQMMPFYEQFLHKNASLNYAHKHHETGDKRGVSDGEQKAFPEK